MVTRSGVGRTCTTVRPAGINGKRRLDMDLRGRECSSYVLIVAARRHPTARQMRENQNFDAD